MSQMMLMILINGLVLSSIYAMLAVGFSLVFGVARILNMAHTGFYMVTAYLIFTARSVIGLPLWMSTVLAIIATSILGMVCYRLLFDRVKVHETAVMIISIALAILFQEILLLIFAGRYRNISPFIMGYFEIVGIRVPYQQILAIVASILVLLALWILLQKSWLGVSIRAVANDPETANLMGIGVGRVCMITIGISTALAGVASAVVVPVFVLEPYMWLHPLIMILAVVVLGGIGSIKGSIIGAFVLGFAETAVVFLIPGGGFLRGAVSLSIMVIVLTIRPEGLFGVVFEEERL